MIAVNGAVLLLFGALLVAVFYLLRSTPRARGTHRQPTSIVMNTPGPCHVTACTYPGTHAVRLDDKTVRVCPGHHDEGYVRGWWTPKPDPTRDRTGAAL